MKIINILSLATIALALEAAAATTATLSLKDGSTLKAELKTEKIACSTLFAKALGLEPAIVKSISFNGKEGEAKVELTNGDKLTASIENPSFKVSSMLGELDIPKAIIRSMTLVTCEGVVPGADAGLVFHCTFDDEAAVTSPAVGPGGRYLGGTFEAGKVGNAMYAPPYTPCAAFNLQPNFFSTRGTIEFWAKIRKTSPYVGWGGDPRLFTISNIATGDTFCTLDIVSNVGGGNSGASTWTILGNTASIAGMNPKLTYDEIIPGGNYKEWHHYAIVWDIDGLAEIDDGRKIATYIDGKLLPCGKTVNRSVADIERILSEPSLLSFTFDPNRDRQHNTKSPFLIDEFKVWNCARFDLFDK